MQFKTIIIIAIIAFILGALSVWILKPPEYIPGKSVTRIDTHLVIRDSPVISVRGRGKITFKTAGVANHTSLPPDSAATDDAGSRKILANIFDGISLVQDSIPQRDLLREYWCSRPYVMTFDTTVFGYAIHYEHEMPLNITAASIKPPPDTTVMIMKENIQYLEKPTPWFQTPYAEAAKLIIYAGAGYWLAK